MQLSIGQYVNNLHCILEMVARAPSLGFRQRETVIEEGKISVRMVATHASGKTIRFEVVFLLDRGNCEPSAFSPEPYGNPLEAIVCGAVPFHELERGFSRYVRQILMPGLVGSWHVN